MRCMFAPKGSFFSKKLIIGIVLFGNKRKDSVHLQNVIFLHLVRATLTYFDYLLWKSDSMAPILIFFFTCNVYALFGITFIFKTDTS